MTATSDPRWWNLIAMILLLGLVWLGVLPYLAGIPSVKNHIELLERRNINAGAMFYTEVQENR